MEESEPEKLLILWTSGDRDVAVNVVLMYALNSVRQGWWEHVSLVLWGPSQPLFAGDEGIQSEVKALQDAGCRVMACVACAKNYQLVDVLKSRGMEVFGMGPVLTNWLKSGSKVITF
jgi:hypothetical protein